MQLVLKAMYYFYPLYGGIVELARESIADETSILVLIG